MICLNKELSEDISKGCPAVLTAEFEKLLDLALKTIETYCTETKADSAYLFGIENDFTAELVCCGNKSCLEKAEAEMFAKHGFKLEAERFYPDLQELDELMTCPYCGEYLNTKLAFVEQELTILEEWESWGVFELKQNAFNIKAILQACPTIDHEISYSARVTDKNLQNELKSREEFYQRIGKLAQAVINELCREVK